MKKYPELKLKVAKQKDLPDYVIINGVYYEKIKGKSSTIDIDLDKTSIDFIKKRMKDFGYANEAEVIRDVIRRKVFPNA